MAHAKLILSSSINTFFAGHLAKSAIGAMTLDAARGGMAVSFPAKNMEIVYVGTGLTANGVTPTGGVVTALKVYIGGSLAAELSSFGNWQFADVFTAAFRAAYLEQSNSVIASDWAHTILGGNLADSLYIGAGQSTVYAGAGNDAIHVQASVREMGAYISAKLVDGGLGYDTLHFAADRGAGGGASVENVDFKSIERLIFDANVYVWISAREIAVGSIAPTASLISSGGTLNVVQSLGVALDFSGFTVIGTHKFSTSGTVGDDVQIGNAATGDSLGGREGNDVLAGLAGADALYGGVGNDTLNGGAGADEMSGGGGNDTFIVDSIGDRVYEDADSEGGFFNEFVGGVDVVKTVISLTLSANVENGVAIGAGAINLGGNAANNILVGNAAANKLLGAGGADRLVGAAGNDVLAGATGADRLSGGTGADVFVFATGYGADVITDFSGAGVGHDRIDLRSLASVTSFADLKASHMAQVGANVVITGGAGDVLTLTGVSLGALVATDFLI